MSPGVRLVSFLGTTPYIPIRYALDGRVTEVPRTFVQSAIAELLRSEIVEVTVLTTRQATRTHWLALTEELEKVGMKEVCQRLIPDGHSEEELWEIFPAVGETLEGAESFIFDITHGFRSLPATGVFSLAFYLHLLPVRLSRILYGALEALEDERGCRPELLSGQAIFAAVKEMSPEQRKAYHAPVFDLTAMHTVPRWAEAAAEWQRTGRAAGIVELAQPFTAAITRKLMKQRPKSLTDLPRRLELLDDALTLVRHDKIAESARAVAQLVEEARVQAAGTPQLAPFTRVIQQLGKSVSPICQGEEQDPACNPSYLAGQVAAARWHGARGRIVEAFSLLRECVTSVAVRVVLDAQAATLPLDGRGHGVQSTSLRQECDRLLAGLSGTHDHHGSVRERSGESDDGQVSALSVQDARFVQREEVDELLQRFPSLKEVFARAWNLVQTTRNKLNHCWTGDHSAQGFDKHTMEEVHRRFDLALKEVQALLSELASCEQSLGLVDPATSDSLLDGVAPPSRLLNLSDQPLETWSPEQLAAAKNLGLGEPVDLPGGMPSVPADADELEVARLAAAIVARAGAGVRGALFDGDPTLTVALLALLQPAGVRCFAATTAPRVPHPTEIAGTSLEESQSYFVRWREYQEV